MIVEEELSSVNYVHMILGEQLSTANYVHIPEAETRYSLFSSKMGVFYFNGTAGGGVFPKENSDK